ncbi:biotin-dependent carboxyltransferase family protein [Planosporangium thailandense]|uniref:Biotin-dependent carboxyltransferase family protein n=1 Tax=Planosporangium thailandense TaxID=765197 RepID=A0ABX0Y535_9ACTN|nr:biotin-dependent carboxyltransferase family protein [Planosporangium thailandense]NJC72507.1 biotin-dependent carboxyltransferase family protein [Planosporangium thailandense]
MIEVIRPGPLTTVQDLGRPGWAALGVSPSGAADLGALRLANRLVGNPESAACLEITLGGLVARFDEAAIVALTGAPAPVRVGDRQGFLNGPFTVRAGERLVLGAPQRALRTYLAVRGGIDAAPVFGSRSTDLLSGLGPAPVTAGARLPVGDAVAGMPTVDLAPVPVAPGDLVLRVLAGPRDDWITAEARRLFASAPYAVSARSNRVGVRLEGPPLVLARRDELPSEGIVRGAVQVPPDGRPVLFLADHPVTGGYPVIGVVEPPDLDLLGQARPGERVSLRWIGR